MHIAMTWSRLGLPMSPWPGLWSAIIVIRIGGTDTKYLLTTNGNHVILTYANHLIFIYANHVIWYKWIILFCLYLLHIIFLNILWKISMRNACNMNALGLLMSLLLAIITLFSLLMCFMLKVLFAVKILYKGEFVILGHFFFNNKIVHFLYLWPTFMTLN